MPRLVPFLALFGTITIACAADDPKQAELKKKPQWQRLLSGEDAKKSLELEKRFRSLAANDDYAGARKTANELLTYRTERQGQDHFQTRTLEFEIQSLIKVGALDQDARRDWRSLEEIEREAGRFVQSRAFARAEPLQRKILEKRRAVLGEDHPSTANGYNNLAYVLDEMKQPKEARSMYDRALEIRRATLGERHPDTARSWFNLAGFLSNRNRFKEANEPYLKALEIRLECLGENHPETLRNFDDYATNLKDQSRYSDADEYYRKALTIRSKTLGEDHPDTATSYAYVGMTTSLLGKPKEALTLFEKALTIRLKAFGEQNVMTARSLNLLGNHLNEMGRYADAEGHLRKALDINRAIHGPKHVNVAYGYNNLAFNLMSQAKYDEALPLFEKSRDILLALRGENHPETATAYNNLGGVYSKLARYDEARTAFERALKIRREVLGEEHLDTATSLNNVAGILNDTGHGPEALVLHLRALEIRRRILGELHPVTASSIHNLGFFYNDRWRYAEAESLFRKGLDLRIKLFGERHLDVAMSHFGLATNLESQGRYTEAQRHAESALRLRRELLGERHPLTAKCYNLTAMILSDQKRHQEANVHYQKSLEITIAALGESHPETALCYNNLAYNRFEQKEYAEAERLYRRSRDLIEARFGENHHLTATAISNLAGNIEAQGRHFEAQPLLKKSLEIRIKVLGEDHPQTANGYLILGVNYNRQALYAEAGPYFRKALERFRRCYGETHPQTAAAYSRCIYNDLALGRTEAAENLLNEACFAYEASRMTAAEGLDRAALDRFNPRVLLAALKQSRDPVRAVTEIELTLARGLLDHQAGSQLTLSEEETRLFEDSKRRLEKERADLARSLAGTAGNTPDPMRLDAIVNRLREAERTISRLAIQSSERDIATLESIQSRLAPDAAILLWNDFADHTDQVHEHYACVIRNSGPPKFERLPGGGSKGEWSQDDIRLLANFRTVFDQKQSSDAYEALATRVRDQRIAPAAKHLEGVKTLYCVPGEWMAGIPIEALTRDYSISYIPSGSFLARLKPISNPTRTAALVLGDPIYSDPAAPRRPATETHALRSGWADLPGTRVETNRLKELFGESAKVLTDGDASEQTLESLRKSGELAKYRYLHFATHGEGNSVRAFESSLILTQDKLPKDSLPKAGEPWINGQLSAREVLDYWKLDAELVTLSACETAIGKSGGGDGLLGFAQAFLTAGARSVCLSLWKVDDTATALLMSRFYENLLGRREGLAKPMGKAAALDEAKRWLRNLSLEEATARTAKISTGVARGTRGKGVDLKVAATEAKDTKPFAHPKYWAAFILIGDPN